MYGYISAVYYMYYTVITPNLKNTNLPAWAHYARQHNGPDAIIERKVYFCQNSYCI